MKRRRPTAAVTGSPLLIGAVTVLVAIVAVFLAYNANAGLPFVPTYDIRAEVPSGGKLVVGNEVRAGGFRVGIIDEIRPKRITVNGRERTVAELSLKLDKVVEPLPVDSRIVVRPRSALGLKYVELTPGTSEQTVPAGGTLPLGRSRVALDLEDVYTMFDEDTRPRIQTATEGFGDALAGRGRDLNATIEALNPFMRHLAPVMRNLARADTELDRFIAELGRAAAQVAPVAEVQARLFGEMATTFGAIARDPAALEQTIARSPQTLAVGTQSLRVQRPFLADFADLSRRLRPAAQELRRALPRLNRAQVAGIEVLPRTDDLGDRLERVAASLDELVANPNTLLAIRDLREALAVTRPAIEFIAPYQTVCSYANYFLHGLGEHQSQTTLGGTVQNQGLKLANLIQPNTIANTESSRPWDVGPNEDPLRARNAVGALGRFYTQPYQPAIDAQGNADCQVGQNGYVKGPLSPNARYGRGFAPNGTTPSGGNWAVTQSDFPILSGGTYISRELGIDNLEDVP